MHVLPECYACLERLTKQTLGLCFSQKNIRAREQARITKVILSQLQRNFSSHTVPAELFSRINRTIKKQTSVRDPFFPRKTEEIHHARAVSKKLFRERRPHSLHELLMFSVRGNSLDFFKPIEESIRHIHAPARLVAPGLKALKEKLRQPCRIVFFADNCGESFFDLPLVRYLTRRHHITYVVKSRPIQNDLTMTDLGRSGIKRHFSSVKACGNDAVGIELKTLAGPLKKQLARCDLIIAKGMGYYETFTELPQYRGKVFHLLMAKCRPVAKSLGVPLNSFVLLKRE